MKYPEVISAEFALPKLEQFDTIIDVRSQSEFALDHIPGAINCPVLDDAERVLVGTLYRQQGAFEAKKVGGPIVARNIAHHIETHFADRGKVWRPLVYCWRGGNRSGSMALIMARIGWPVAQLDGGYKAFRAQVTIDLDQLPAFDFRVVCGTTGSGKTRLLQTLAARGAQVLDLEQLAAHRGSLLGSLPHEPQPSQKMFETRVWHTLRGFDPGRPVFVEAESRKVGQLRVPELLMERMRASPCLDLQLARPHRVQLLMQDYAHFCADPSLLSERLGHLVQLHGHARINEWQAMAAAGALPQLVDQLLALHYDPAYLRSIDRNFVQYPNAQQLVLDDIYEASFLALARQLHG